MSQSSSTTASSNRIFSIIRAEKKIFAIKLRYSTKTTKKTSKRDIKDAYYSNPIIEKHQKYIQFLFDGKRYQFTCLPNNLCFGPRKCTKSLKVPFALLHQMLLDIAAYIDVLFTCSSNYEKCEQNYMLLVTSSVFWLYYSPQKLHFCSNKMFTLMSTVI